MVDVVSCGADGSDVALVASEPLVVMIDDAFVVLGSVKAMSMSRIVWFRNQRSGRRCKPW